MFEVSVPGGDARSPFPSSVAGSLLKSVVTSEDDMLIAGPVVVTCVHESDRSCSSFAAASAVAIVRARDWRLAWIAIDTSTDEPAAMTAITPDAITTSRSAKPRACCLPEREDTGTSRGTEVQHT